MKLKIFILTLCFTTISLADNLKDSDVLVSTQETKIKKDGSSVETYDIVEKVLTEAGRTKLSISKINFIKSETNFRLISAFTLNGIKKSIIAPSSVKIRNADQAKGGISDTMEAVISYNNVQIGSEVHTKYELSKISVFKNIFSTMFGVTNSGLAKKENYTYISEVPFLTSEKDFGNFFKIIKTKKPGRYTLFIEPTPVAYAFVGSHVETAILSLTTAQSWKQLREYEVTLFAPSLKRPLPKKYQEISESAKKMLSSKETFNYVASELSKLITYSGDWQTRSGKLSPQIMDAVVFRGKGDCKDYTTGMVAILRSLGYDANPFLTFRSNSYTGIENLTNLAKIPNPSYFNHVIVHVKEKNGQVWWIDPTNPYVQADNITSDILGNFGLLLDQKTNEPTFLPAKNVQSADANLEQILRLSADNTISGQGFMTMTPSSYNSIGIVQRLYGNEGVAKFFSYILNPTSKKTTLQINNSDPKKMRFDFSFYARDWVAEEQKAKAIIAFQELGLLGNRVELDKDSDLGEPGETIITTHIKDQKVIDTMNAGCLMRSHWIDANRTIENKVDEILITDTIKIKERFISKREAHGDIFEQFLSDISSCTKASTVLLKLDSSLKTPEYMEAEKISGPRIESMQEADADRLFEIEGPAQNHNILLKLARYYEKRIIQNSKDAKSFFRLGIVLARLGYIKSNLYVPENLKEAVLNINQAIQFAKAEDNPFYISKKIVFLLSANEIPLALSAFRELNMKFPKTFETFLSAANISTYQNKQIDAEHWLAAGQSYAKTEKQKISFHSLMQEILMTQKRTQEAIPHQEYVAKLSPKNAWAWHNLAVLYFEIKDYDKAIEIDQKALAITEFGMAKKIISDSYYKKYQMTKDKGIRNIASISNDEELLQNAVKYYPNNIEALADLGLFYANEYSKTKDKLFLSKGRNYLDQAAKIEPRNNAVVMTLQIYSDLEKKSSKH